MYVCMEESSKKKSVRSTWNGHVKRNGRRQIAKESRCPESGGETEASNIEIAMGDCIKSDLEIVGEELGKW